MDAHSVFERLIHTDEIRGDITLSFGSFVNDSEVPVYRSLNISEDLKDEFLTIVNRANFSLRKDYQNHDLKILEYDPGYKPEKYEIEWIDISKIDYLSDILHEIPEPVDIPLFTAVEAEFFNNLRFYVIIIQTKNSHDP